MILLAEICINKLTDLDYADDAVLLTADTARWHVILKRFSTELRACICVHRGQKSRSQMYAFDLSGGKT